MAPFGRRGLTSWVGLKGVIAPGQAFWRLFKKHVFLERPFSGFFADLLAKMTPKTANTVTFGAPRWCHVAFHCIFGHPVFERPYNDLSLFSHVSGTRKLKKDLREGTSTLLATHRTKHTPRNHAWERKCPKNDPEWRSKWTPGRPHRWVIFTRVAFWATPGHSNLKKHVPGMIFIWKVFRIELSEGGRNSRSYPSRIVFSTWGAFL